jgi:hypothetical protein
VAPIAPEPAPEELSAPEDDDDLQLAPRRDPYRIALLVVSVVLLVLAGGLLGQTLRAPATSDAQAFLLMDLANLGMPALLLAGLIGVLLWILLGVLRRP